MTAMAAARPGTGAVLDKDSGITRSWGAQDPSHSTRAMEGTVSAGAGGLERTSRRPSWFRYTAQCRRTKGVQLTA